MKCPGCGCNYMDDDKYCPMCEMPNNAFARAAHKLRRKQHEDTYDDCVTTTCAHPEEDNSKEARRRRLEQQRAERLSRPAHAPRPATSSARPASSSSKSQKQQTSASRIIKIVIGIFVAVNFILPLLFGIIEEILYFGFF
ncbi:MAG: hypothetical protein IJ452_03770 [Butyricicoccus sp.]|nr:hypothetical protein [Butyricicoccus sp.]MBQ8585387.1 hypothetical protein [Butyricicoccus sp.]